ncbi:hypothetical protein [Bordetella genomosp. 13]|nr:hypothetical protein [Bordetella genomosp. 13]
MTVNQGLAMHDEEFEKTMRKIRSNFAWIYWSLGFISACLLLVNCKLYFG